MSYLNPTSSLIQLGINIDHVATLRNVRGTKYPDPLQAALIAEEAGADVITLHLREDRRHIKDADVIALRPLLRTRMNLEAAVTTEMLAFACQIAPQDVCLVPERRAEITTEGGLDVINNAALIKAAIKQLQAVGIRTSLFIDPDVTQINAALDSGTNAIEIHTGRYADAENPAQQALELQQIQVCVNHAISQGLTVHAGHGLHYTNVQAVASLPGITELNIGHAVVAHALFVGWDNAIRELKALIVTAQRNAIRPAF